MNPVMAFAVRGSFCAVTLPGGVCPTGRVAAPAEQASGRVLLFWCPWQSVTKPAVPNRVALKMEANKPALWAGSGGHSRIVATGHRQSPG